MRVDNTNKDLIRKYIHGEYRPEELADIRKVMLRPDAQILFDEVLAESWTGLEEEKNTEEPRLNQKLQDFYKKLEREEQLVLQRSTSAETIVLRRRASYLRYAAVLAIFIFSIGAYKLLKFKKTPLGEQFAMHELSNPNGQRSKIILPDSSEVFLGAGSKLRYPQQFKAGSREVILEGEAFFQVTKNPKRPFIIHTRTVQTMVLGTSFKIEAFHDRPITVAVATGIVRVDDYAGNHKKSLAVLTPGQKVIYSAGAAVLAATDIADVESWKDGRLVFYRRPLKDITTELERWYNVKFQYQRKAKAEELISITLQANIPLSKIIKVLSATGHFNYKIGDRNVTID